MFRCYKFLLQVIKLVINLVKKLVKFLVIKIVMKRNFSLSQEQQAKKEKGFTRWIAQRQVDKN